MVLYYSRNCQFIKWWFSKIDMKKIKILVVLLIIGFGYNVSGQDPTGMTDATMMLGYWKIRDASKIAKAVTMINTMKESAQAATSIYQSAQSLENLVKEIQRDANSVGDFAALKAKYIDVYIENMKYDFNNAPYIDFYRVYMGETNRFRNVDGSIDMVQVAIDNLSETNSYNNVVADIAGQSYTSSNASASRQLTNMVIRSRAVGAMVNLEDIRILNSQASSYERQAMLIHLKINATLLGANNLQGAESMNDNLEFKRAYIAELQSDQEYYLDMARSLRSEIEMLKTQPIPIPQEIEKLNKQIEGNELQKQNAMINAALRSENRDIKSRWN